MPVAAIIITANIANNPLFEYSFPFKQPKLLLTVIVPVTATLVPSFSTESGISVRNKTA